LYVLGALLEVVERLATGGFGEWPDMSREEEVLPRLPSLPAALDSWSGSRLCFRERCRCASGRAPPTCRPGPEKRIGSCPRPPSRTDACFPRMMNRVKLFMLSWIRSDRLQAVDLGGRLPGDRRRAGSSAASSAARPCLSTSKTGTSRKVPLEPAAALGDGVRMGVDLLHVVRSSPVDVQEVVRHPLDEDLPADEQVVVVTCRGYC